MRSCYLLAIASAYLMSVCQGIAAPADRARIGEFAIDRTEVTIGRFRAFAKATGTTTAAEAGGGGYEWGGGWEQRKGWTVYAPYGQRPATDREPAVHVSWHEAKAFCHWSGGRLPTAAEWRQAAYTESRKQPTDGFEYGRTYRFPVGSDPSGMNTSDNNQGDIWPRHAPVASTKRGVNGLFDMGANVWEWLADRRGDEALTAGGSWWYGPAKTETDGLQYKPASFYAVYVGFRCAYDLAK